MAEPQQHSSRRTFLRQTGTLLVASAPTVLQGAISRTSPSPKPSANERPGIGLVGYGARAAFTAKEASRFGDIVAICDVDQRHLDAGSAAFPAAAVFRDFRRLIERPDVDVIINSTPDHWHTLINLHAVSARKDVYCEAPLTHTYAEGSRLLAAVKKTKSIVQTGLQLRSDARFRLACELTRNGRIGKLRHVIVGLSASASQDGPFLPVQVPAELDWNFWLGPAPLAAYVHERCHGHFRWWWDYSNGALADPGVHLLDIALWGAGLERTPPVMIEAQPLSRPVPGGYTTVARFTIKFTFENKLVFTCTTESPVGVRFEGATGWIAVSRDSLTASDPGIIEKPLLSSARRLYASEDHMANFFECTRSRKIPAADPESALRAANLCHLGSIGLRMDRPLGWNPSKERFISDSEADSLLAVEQRKPFTYEMLA